MKQVMADEVGFKYKYNGKELQDELGLNVYDYGARIYEPAAPHFWQIDPLAEKYNTQSPYVYADNNPVLFVDVNGMGAEENQTDYKLDKKTGKVTRKDPNDGSEKNKNDRLYATDDCGNVNKNVKPLVINKNKASDRTVISDLANESTTFVGNTGYWGKKIGHYSETNSKQKAYKLFYFVSNNSNAEWALSEFTHNRFIVSTLHFSESTAIPFTKLKLQYFDLINFYHSHPGTSPKDDVASGMGGDQGFASKVIWDYINKQKKYSLTHPGFFIYRPALKKRFQYNPWDNKFNIKKVLNYKSLYVK